MTLAISGPTPENLTAGLTPTSTGCDSSLATTVCTFSYYLAPGSYTATIATYDQAPVGGSIPGGAKLLSTAQGVAFTITPGQTNDVGLTLSGVPASIAVVPLAGLNAGGSGQTVDLIGLGAQRFMVQALDADGNTIFGAGAPTFTVAASGSLAVTLGQPSAAAPNLFTVTPPSAFSTATATLTVTATYAGQATNGCAQAGAVCTASFAADMKELLAVNQTYDVVFYVAGQPSQIASISDLYSNSGGVQVLTFDSAANLIVARCQTACNYGGSPDSVLVYAPPYNGVPVQITKGVYNPQSIVLDSSGNLWVGNCYSCTFGGSSDTITKYAPPLTSSSAPVLTISSNVTDPLALAFDHSGNLWVANCATCASGSTDTVTEYSPAGVQQTPTLTGLSRPMGLAIDSSGDVFVANNTGPNVKEFVPPSYSSSSPATINTVGGTPLARPAGLYQSGSDLWIVDNTAGSNGEVFECGLPIAGTDCTTSLAVTSGINRPIALAFDAQPTLYVVNQGGNNNVTEYASPFTALTAQTNSNYGNALAVLP